VDSLHVALDSGVTVLFGASGSGKTTVLRCLAGLDAPSTGRIELGGKVWCDCALGKFVQPEHRRVGFVPQDYLLFPHLTVAQNIAYGLHKLSNAERRDTVERTILWLGLDGLSARLPSELSGGQQQRVALARAVACSPQLLLLDEPLSALDAPSRQRLRTELRHWLAQLRLPTLLVTHDRTEALALGHQIVVLDQGRIQQAGPVAEVFNRPAKVTLARIFGMETVVSGQIVARADGLATARIGTVTLQAVANDLPADATSVHVCIRAEDVVLTRDAGGASSPRNQLPAMVVSVHPELPLARVELDCGFPLKALITRQALEQLNVRPGERLSVWVKAPHVHLIAA
jgi:molybdate transport system ATP-binding protein